MRVRTTILLLMLLACAAFVAGLAAMHQSNLKQITIVAADQRNTWKGAVKAALKAEAAPLETMVVECARMSEALAAVVDGKRAWAEAEWDEKVLRSFNANAVWVYRRDGFLFYQLANALPAELAQLPIPKDTMERMIAAGKPVRFYFDIPPDEKGGRRVVEVRGAPVRPESDTQTLEAFLFGGRVWDTEEIHEVFPLLLGVGEILSADAAIPKEEDGRMVYPEYWGDWQARNIAQFVVTTRSKPLATLESSNDRLFIILAIGALVLFVFLYLLLHFAVIRPLCQVIDALHDEDITPLQSMERHKAEFGELARLLRSFFDQQLELTREMLERIGTEKALRMNEEMLRHSQKMEAVGRLAGGVAHDFNNLLTAIIGYADLLRNRLAHDPSVCQSADMIHQAGEQAAGLTRQLLAFSRKQLLQPKVVDLNVIVTNLHRLLQRIIGEHIIIRPAPEASLACVKADPGQLAQVIVNLGVNARDAMPRGGTLTIRTVNFSIERPDGDLQPGDYVALEVTDTGEGMDSETKARIFEPFFTTKGPGKGTGLGLATVYGIVRQSQGGIQVESEKGVGSTFRILLPRVDEQPEVSSGVQVVTARATGEETILFVEDEEIVRDLVCEVLRSQGYRVLCTDRGSEAVRLATEEQGKIDLLISDVVMPEMNGAEVARRVHEVAPSAQVIFVSGYSESDMADQGLGTLAFEVLQKPFTPSTLAAKIREVLDGAGKA